MIVEVKKTIKGSLVSYSGILDALFAKGGYHIESAKTETYREPFTEMLKTDIYIKVNVKQDDDWKLLN
jgi:hypothetical protein